MAGGCLAPQAALGKTVLAPGPPWSRVNSQSFHSLVSSFTSDFLPISTAPGAAPGAEGAQ